MGGGVADTHMNAVGFVLDLKALGIADLDGICVAIGIRKGRVRLGKEFVGTELLMVGMSTVTGGYACCDK